MKQHFYISTFLLILFVSLVILNKNSIPCSWKGSEKQLLENRKLTTEKWSLKNVSFDNQRNTGDQSAKTTMFAGPQVDQDINLTTLLFDRFLSNPILIDLPPPANQHQPIPEKGQDP